MDRLKKCNSGNARPVKARQSPAGYHVETKPWDHDTSIINTTPQLASDDPPWPPMTPPEKNISKTNNRRSLHYIDLKLFIFLIWGAKRVSSYFIYNTVVVVTQILLRKTFRAENIYSYLFFFNRKTILLSVIFCFANQHNIESAFVQHFLQIREKGITFNWK